MTKHVATSSLRFPRSRRGFLVMDAVAGITLALFLLMMMTVMMVKQERRERELADTRTASRAAEGAMLSMQAGGSLPATAHIEKLSDASSGPGGRVWVRVTATEHGRSADVVGLVDARSITTTGGAP